MALWFLRGLRKGVVTSRYPAVPDPIAELLPSPPSFDSSRLSRRTADLVITVCPSRALRREEDTLLFDLGACTSCGRCLAVAADAARASGIFELAAIRRDDLIKPIPIRGGP